jgi:hypothetical protein
MMSSSVATTTANNAAATKKKETPPRTKLILLPGMGCTPVKSCNFYGWLDAKIKSDSELRDKYALELRDFPDPHLVRRAFAAVVFSFVSL